jgi:hypothetical protein
LIAIATTISTIIKSIPPYGATSFHPCISHISFFTNFLKHCPKTPTTITKLTLPNKHPHTHAYKHKCKHKHVHKHKYMHIHKYKHIHIHTTIYYPPQNQYTYTTITITYLNTSSHHNINNINPTSLTYIPTYQLPL